MIYSFIRGVCINLGLSKPGGELSLTQQITTLKWFNFLRSGVTIKIPAVSNFVGTVFKISIKMFRNDRTKQINMFAVLVKSSTSNDRDLYK